MTQPRRASRLRPALAAGIALVLLAAAAAAPAANAPLHRDSGNLVFDGIPPPDGALGERLSRYLESRGASLLDWLPDGSVLVATRFGDTEQLHRIAAPLGTREQLTFYPDPVTVARTAPAGGGLVFLKDQGGDENAQLYYRSPDGAVRALTSGKFVHGSPVWAHDSRRVAFYGNDRDGVGRDVYIADVGAHAAAQLLVGGGKTDTRADTWYPLDWSTDDAKLLVERYVSASESYLYIADVASGALTPVDPHANKAGIRAAKLSPDGHGVYELSDEAGEFTQLLYRDLVTHETRRLTPDDAGWDVEEFDLSADGRYLAYVVNQDGRSRLALEDITSRIATSPAGIPEGVISGLRFDRSGDRLALSVETAQSPRDVYVYDLRHDKLERWTRSEPGPIDGARPHHPGAGALPHLGPRCRPPAHVVGLPLPAAHRVGSLPGRGPDSRRSGSAVPPGLGTVRPVPGERARLRRGRTQRARLLGLRQELPGTRRRRAAGGCGARHRLAAGVARGAGGVRS